MKKHLYLILTILLLSTSLYAQLGQYGMKFDGANDYVVVPHNANLNFTQFTIEAWIFKTDNDHTKIVGKTASNNPAPGFIFGTVYFEGKNVLQFEARQDASNYDFLRSTEEIPLNQWVHLAMTWNSGGFLKGYINGKEALSGVAKTLTITNNNSMYIGRAPWSHVIEDHFGGIIDEIRIWNDVRTADEIREFMYKDVSAEANLVSYYKMSDGTGTTLTDNKNSNDGTLTNGPIWIASGALDGARKGLNFDGTNEYVDFATDPSYNNTAITIEAWIKPNFNNDEKPIVTWYSAFNNVVEFRRGSGRLEFGMNDGSFAMVGGNVALTSGEWAHVAVTKDGNNIKLYVNGVLDASGTITKTNVPTAFRIGYLAHYNTYFTGQIDEVRIWDDVRTESEIRENMTKSLVGNESNLIAYYRFNEGDGTTLYDYTSNNNDGTLTNMDAATDWVKSEAFSTWIGVENATWTNAANWSDGVPTSAYSAGLYKWTLANVTTYDATINGSPALNNLLVSSTSAPTLSSGVTINANLLLEKNLGLNGQTVTISSNGKLVESSGVFSGATGQITTTRNLSGITAQNVGGLGAVITTAANMGSTTITRTHSAGGFENRSILRKYNIVPTNNTGLNATLIFNYLAGELNSNTEASLKAYKSTNSGTLWSYEGGTVDAGNNSLTISGLDGFSLWTLSDAALNEVIYVDADAVGGNDGSDWTNAFTSLQSALDIASAGNQIWVAAGTYKPSYDYGLGGGSRYYHFRMIEGVEIYGGFAGTETATSQRTDFGEGGANETILSGDLSGNDVVSGSGSTLSISGNTENCYHVFYHPSGMSPALTNTAILDGFTIKGGNANGTSPHDIGGCILQYSSSPTFRNSIFTSSNASFGAGILNYTSSPVITNCIIHSNNATIDAAGIENYSDSSPIITNCIISGNKATRYAGGMWNEITSSPTITNTTIVGNSAASGGGIYNHTTSLPTINNSIIWGNTATIGKQFYLSNGTTTLNYSCYANGTDDVYIGSGTFTATNNNITSDPSFSDAATGDFRITGSSPCADAGNDASNSETYDIRGNGYGRKLLKTNAGAVGTIDMGAYEYKFGTDPVGCEDEVWVDASFGSHENFGETHFTDLGLALEAVCEGGIVNIATVSNTAYSYDVDFSGLTVNIGNFNFELTGNITDGEVIVTNDGSLVMKELVANTTKSFPITDGTNNYTMTVKTADANSPDISVRIKNNNPTGSMNSDFWDIDGPINLNATITLRVDKAAIAPKTINNNTQLRYYDSSTEKYVPVNGNNFSIEEFDTHYIITITGVNKF